jgi:hypothetical protein
MDQLRNPIPLRKTTSFNEPGQELMTKSFSGPFENIRPMVHSYAQARSVITVLKFRPAGFNNCRTGWFPSGNCNMAGKRVFRIRSVEIDSRA